MIDPGTGLTILGSAIGGAKAVLLILWIDPIFPLPIAKSAPISLIEFQNTHTLGRPLKKGSST